MIPEMRVKLRCMIMTNEGFNGHLYSDKTGNLTIGYGHNLHERPISQNVGAVILDEDIQWFLTKLDTTFHWFYELDDNRKCVLIDMAFNLGFQGLLAFKNMLESIESKNYVQASVNMLDSDWAHQVGDRAKRDAYIMKTGEMV